MSKTKVTMPLFGEPPGDTGPKMLIATEDGIIQLRVPYSPTEIEHTNIAPAFGEITRTADRQPLLVKTGGSLRKMTFTLFFGDSSLTDVGPQLRTLELMCNFDKPLLVHYSYWDGNVKWKITDFSHRDVLHHPVTNAVVRAEASITFTENSTFTSGSGEREMGGMGDQRSLPPEHIVIAGDSMTGIADKYYSDSDLSIKLADFNDISDPRKLRPGQKIRLPRNLQKFNSRDEVI